MPNQDPRQAPIAIVGVSALFPGSQDETGFWRDILAGRDLIREVPPTHWLVDDYYDPNPKAPDKTYARRGAFLDPVDFDALSFGVPPSLVPATDTSQLLALIVAQRVLDEAARGQFATMNKERISVILGVTSGQELLHSMVSRLQRPIWQKSLREAGITESKIQEVCERITSHYVPWQEATFPGLLGNVVAGRIANRFDLGGTNCVTDAACASALSAVSMAVDELCLGRSDLVITGGVDTLNDILMFMCFSKTPALSKTGDCRPFSDDADGTLLGEGLGMVALKRLCDAEAAHDRIYAVLRGIGSSSDGRATSVYAPRSEGQAAALARAYAAAGYGPETVELVEAHGTGTTAGDAAELEALRATFDASGRRDRQWCALGSVKSQIGHTKAAAGAAGLVKAVMALCHGALPPTLKVRRPNPRLDVENSPFYLNTVARPWVRSSDHPRRASVSSFGFGGSNFHVTLEEYRGPAPRAERKRVVARELVLESADSPAALAAALLEKRRAIEGGGEGCLRFLARESQKGCPRDPLSPGARVAILAASEQDLRDKLATAADAITRSPRQELSIPGGIHYSAAAPEGGLAFLFPGQGSQYLGMGAALALTWPEALAAWDLAADLPAGDTGRLHDIVFPRPAFCEQEREAQAERLRRTECAQPALGAASLAQLNLLTALGVRPDCVAGHSFGEIMALHAAGAFDAATMLQIARRRGELMAEAAAHSPGGMSAAHAPIDEVRSVVAAIEGVVVANHNAPEQVVLSGDLEALAHAEEALRHRQIRTDRLAVAAAFHSPAVSASRAPFLAFLEGLSLSPTSLPVYSNAEAAPYPTGPVAMRELLASQLARPVRFCEQIQAMVAAGVRTFVEVGAGSVLTGLVQRILSGSRCRAIALDVKGENAAVAFQDGLARLWTAGVQVDFRPLWADFQEVGDPRRAKGAALALTLCGANYGKPYPPPEGKAALPRPSRETETCAEPDTGGTSATASQAAARAGEQAAWVSAYQQMQHETLAAHTAWQEAMTNTHLAFLRTAERSFTELASRGNTTGPNATGPSATVANATGVAEMPPLPLPAPISSAHTVAVLPATSAEPALRRGTVSETVMPWMNRQELHRGALSVDQSRDGLYARPQAERSQRGSGGDEPRPYTLGSQARRSCLDLTELGAVAPSIESAPKTTFPAGHVTETLLQVVAEKTGYPAEMLRLEMGLDSDLGIDSIKRVEIFSGLRERLPDLPEIEPAAMVGLRTLGAILDCLTMPAAGGGGPSFASAAPAAPEAAPEPEVIERLEVQAVERPAPGLGMAGLLSSRLVGVIGDDAAVGEALVAELLARGLNAQRLGSAASVAGADAVIVLSGLGASDEEAAAQAVRRTFRVARELASRFSDEGGIFVTVQDTGGDFGLSGTERAWLGGIAGIAKTAAVEWPRARVRAIDLARGDRDAGAVATAIVAELLEGGPELEVGLGADGRRVTLRMAPRELPAEELSSLDPASVVVATGGARGVTAACLAALAGRIGGRFALLGRTPLVEEPACCKGVDADGLTRTLLAAARADKRELPPAALGLQVRAILAGREVRRTLEAIRTAGGQALYEAVDVRDQPSVEAALGRVRASFGPISAIVHGAGVLADRLIGQKTYEQFAEVFDTKVRGLRSLLAATASDPLQVVCLFSSIAARLGNAGQCDYAAANEVLNKVARLEARRRGGRCAVHSIGWGPWEGGMVTGGVRDQFLARGVPLLPVAEGARRFVSECQGAGPVEVVIRAASRRAKVPGASPSDLAFDMVVNRASHPYLVDHSIEDVPVLPVALALEWFARAARAASTDAPLELVACRGLKVRKGARLERFDDGGDRFRVRCRREAGRANGWSLELLGADGSLHYTAAAEMADRHPQPPPADRFELGELGELGQLGRAVYGRELFHGPELQVIRRVEGVSQRGAVATLVGTSERRWSGAWHTDVAAVDGALQLAVLWTGHVLACRALPTAVGSYQAYRLGPPQGELRCVVRGQVVDSSKSRCDVSLSAGDGTLVLELRDVEIHGRPDLSRGSSTP